MAEKKKPISVKERMKERKKGEEKQKQVEDLVRQAFTQAMPKIDLIFQIAKDGWNHVVNWTDHFYVFDKDKKNKPGILVLIEDLSDKEIGEDKRGEEWLKTS